MITQNINLTKGCILTPLNEEMERINNMIIVRFPYLYALFCRFIFNLESVLEVCSLSGLDQFSSIRLGSSRRLTLEDNID